MKVLVEEAQCEHGRQLTKALEECKTQYSRQIEETRLELQGRNIWIKAIQELHLIELRKKYSEVKDVCKSLVDKRKKINE